MTPYEEAKANLEKVLRQIADAGGSLIFFDNGYGSIHIHPDYGDLAIDKGTLDQIVVEMPKP